MRQIRKSQIRQIINECVKEYISKERLFEGDSFTDDPEIEAGIRKLGYLDEYVFFNEMKKRGGSNMDIAEYVFNKYFSNVPIPEFIQQLGKNMRLTKELKRLGGFKLIYCLYEYCRGLK